MNNLLPTHATILSQYFFTHPCITVLCKARPASRALKGAARAALRAGTFGPRRRMRCWRRQSSVQGSGTTALAGLRPALRSQPSALYRALPAPTAQAPARTKGPGPKGSSGRNIRSSLAKAKCTEGAGKARCRVRSVELVGRDG